MNKQQLQSNNRRQVLIVSRDVIGEQIAGPGVRYLEMARRLSRLGHGVTLMAPGLQQWADEGFGVEDLTGRGFDRALVHNEIVISQGFAYSAWTTATTGAVQVIDLYAPLQLEMLEAGPSGHRSEAEAAFYRRYVARRLRLLMACGDFFLCASERQRDLWLGSLAAAGRLNRANHQRDTDLRGLIDCVPFGTPTAPFPDSTAKNSARRAVGRFGESDFLLLWGGGIWPWLDPRTAIRATALAAEQRPGVKLLFLGSGHPNPGVTTGDRTAAEARRYAGELGVLDRSVFFSDDWVPYEKRVDYLAACDAGLLAHHRGIETRYAFRTRLLDCFWAGRPVITTGGDELSSQVRHHGAGTVVRPGDAEALAAAIIDLHDDGERRAAAGAAASALGQRYRWDRVFTPLERFVDRPHTRRSRGESGGAPGGRMAALGYALSVAALGMRHGLWRRALGKIVPAGRSR
jgi:glycosyltransferase involved in cell wall biosynthesis